MTVPTLPRLLALQYSTILYSRALVKTGKAWTRMAASGQRELTAIPNWPARIQFPTVKGIRPRICKRDAWSERGIRPRICTRDPWQRQRNSAQNLHTGMHGQGEDSAQNLQKGSVARGEGPRICKRDPWPEGKRNSAQNLQKGSVARGRGTERGAPPHGRAALPASRGEK